MFAIRSLGRNAIAGLALALTISAFLIPARRASAIPEYARRESLACQACHISSAPGYTDQKTGEKQSVEPNERGRYYAEHAHTFAGYVAKGTEKQIIPRFHWNWDASVSGSHSRRMAVGDVKGDGKPRLVLLNEKPGSKETAILVVKKWDGKDFVTEFTADVQATPDKLQVGKFAGEKKPAVIVTGDAFWLWDGKTFVRKPAGHPLPLLGTTWLKDGSERLMITEGQEGAKAYRVDPDAGEALIDGIAVPPSRQVVWGDLHGTPEFFANMGLPQQLGGGGLIGLWRWPGHDHLYLYYARVNVDFDVKANVENKFKPNDASGLVVKGKTSQLSLTEPLDPTAPNVWATPEFDGIIYDVLPLDPRTGKPGLLILSGDPSGNARMLSFYALD